MKGFDYTGYRFGKLVAVEYVEKYQWRCACDCGNEKVAPTGSLKGGRVASCGCLSTGWKKITHGRRDTAEYRTWAHMKYRCGNSKCKDFKNYGGRGITVCERWLESFENFYADMGGKPTPSHSIDRINNDGGYGPENCRWATKLEQNNNQRPRRPNGA